MCGIVGYVGHRECSGVLLDGLKRLEYRGYDSAGIAVRGGSATRVVRCRGKIAELEALVSQNPPRGSLGIGHTRWATHGRPSEENAHPHRYGRVTLVHNGIIENHLGLRQGLRGRGHDFKSETDTEILAHLLDEELVRDGEPLAALRRVLASVRGVYAVCALVDGHEDLLICAKKDAPLVIGVAEKETLVASDIPSILQYTRKMIFLGDGEMAAVRADGVVLQDLEGKPVEREPREITWSAMAAEKEGYPHFMLKELHEQPRAVADTLRGRLSVEQGEVHLDDVDLDPTGLGRIYLVACGTSYHACLVGKFLIEGLARLPVEVDLGSEFRYRDPLIGPKDLLIAVSQSGETADTLAALREASGKGARVVSIVNVVDSSMARASDATLYTHAGPEIGVASTKAFTAQLAALSLLAVHLGRRTGSLALESAREIIEGLSSLPHLMHDVLSLDAQTQSIARRYASARDWLFLGRGVNYPIALEGALKLKEISYVHAEGYPAGEMKHGPIALVDKRVPVVILAPRGPGYEKVMSNLQEIRSREGKIIAVATRGDREVGAVADDLILIPDVQPILQPLLTVLPLQLLAYHVASRLGAEIDQPRNLAKSVTVE